MKILAAIDGSEAAFNALRAACLMAQKTMASVAALHVSPGEEYTAEEAGSLSLTEKIAAELEARGQETIRTAYAIGRELGVTLQGMLSYGIPAEEILNYADAHGIVKLITMAHSSKGRGAQEFVDSPTRIVSARSKVPVFVTSSAVEVKRILIAVDSSDRTLAVASLGARLASSLGAELSVVAFVPEVDALIDEYRLIADVPNMDRHLEASAKDLKKVLDEAITKAQSILSASDIKVAEIMRKSRAEELIAESGKNDLLVFGIKKNDAAPTRLSSFTNKLLLSPSVNAIFVQ